MKRERSVTLTMDEVMQAVTAMYDSIPKSRMLRVETVLNLNPVVNEVKSFIISWEETE